MSENSDKTAVTKSFLDVCIIVPTYNESGNIVTLLDRIFLNDKKHSQAQNAQVSVLVVDDNSPDGTAKLVQQYQKKNKRVHLLSRAEKNGLGAAYIAGMTYAMNTLKPDVVFEMDADLSHNPDDVFRLIAGIQQGADFVIGSRYIPGGSIPEEWGLHRKFISKAANIYTKTILSMGDVKDCTGGFRAIRVSALKTIDLSKLSVKGYAFQISLLEAFINKGFVVAEVPIAFNDRTLGSSKMRFKDIAEFGSVVLQLRAARMFSSNDQKHASGRQAART
jgi:dolichol-phosphate mannosyltransferase